jgi:hypothetical protein
MNALNAACATGIFIGVDHHTVQLNSVPRRFHSSGETAQKTLDDGFFFDTDYGIMRASAVGIWVWVPIIAVARPSRYQPMAIFSLVNSA